MNIKGKNFEILPSTPDKENTMSGANTTVRRRKSVAGGDVAEKQPKYPTQFVLMQKFWLERHVQAKNVSDALREINNPAYHVPKTFISHGRVRDQFVEGTMLRDVPKEYLDAHRDEIIAAIGNLVNDMSEMTSVDIDIDGNFAPEILPGGLTKLDRYLTRLGDGLAAADKKLLLDTYDALNTSPENREYVFSHNDLNPGNILINQQTGRVSIIDFEMSGYQSKLYMMYSMPVIARPEFWAYVNKLPRVKNPNLTWNFDPVTAQTFRFIHNVYNQLSSDTYKPGSEKAKKLTQTISEGCKQLRFILAHARTTDKTRAQNNAIIVPMSHYNAHD